MGHTPHLLVLEGWVIMNEEKEEGQWKMCDRWDELRKEKNEMKRRWKWKCVGDSYLLEIKLFYSI